jgi:nicotinate-nucleotide adenylyltransferase
MRIGLFGGTFDPIHWGHLRSAEEVRETFALDQILFVPTSKPPHKRGQTRTPANDRLAMVRLAVAKNPCFKVSTVEIRRPGISYSIDTLRYFAARNKGNDSFYFILGLDAFREIATWKDFKQLFPLCNFIVTSRPGNRDSNPLRGTSVAVERLFCYDFKRRIYHHRSGTLLQFLKLTDFAVSASDIRKRVRQRKSIRYLVPSAVEAYINKQGLYRRPDRSDRRLGGD